MTKKGYLIEQNEMGHYSYKTYSDCNGYVNKVKLFYSNIGNWTEKYKRKLFLKSETNENFDTTVTFENGKIITLSICELDAVRQIARLMDTESVKPPCNEYIIVKNIK